jgi:hypothetical protein
MSGYLFYSNECKTCLNLIEHMKQEKVLEMFVCKNVTQMSTEEITKLDLQHVPTILMVSVGQNGEQKKGLYAGKSATDWFENLVNNRRMNMIKYTENSKKLIEMHEIKKRMQDGLLGYSNIELAGISDIYSYWSDKLDVDLKLDVAQSKSFVPYDVDAKKFLQQQEQYKIMTIPDVEGNKNDKKKLKGYIINDKEQKKMVSELEKSRESQLDIIKDNMQKEQINSIVKNENKFFQNI